MPDPINDIESNAISISNLNRLGLLELTYDKHITNENFYNDYNDFLKEYIKVNSFDYEVTMQKGTAIVTPLGQQFIKVCISD